jgi:hypothetical protein
LKIIQLLDDALQVAVEELAAARLVRVGWQLTPLAEKDLASQVLVLQVARGRYPILQNCNLSHPPTSPSFTPVLGSPL